MRRVFKFHYFSGNMLHEVSSGQKPQPVRSRTYRILTNLTFWVIIAILLGVLTGVYFPAIGLKMEILSKTFINIIKVFIPPIIFLTIVLGISGMGDLKKVGRIGLKALVYFEVVTTFALVIGVFLAYWFEPGSLGNAENAELRAKLAEATSEVSQTVSRSKEGFSFLRFFLDNITLQVLVAAIVCGIALNFSKRREAVIGYLEIGSKYVFMALKYVMYLAPVAAFGGMAYVISKYGVSTLVPLAKLMGTVYATMILFVFVILGSILWFFRIRIWHVLRYIKDELLIVLGTSSSETALPSIMQKLERMGCSKSVVGLVVPTGYSFNLDGTSIYLSMAVIFLAQFYNVHLSFGEMMGIIGLLVVTSKGAAGVTGSGFIVLASTLTAIHKIPVEGLGLLFGVDKFMSEARAITNLIGNTVATIVISKSEKEFVEPKLKASDPEIPHSF
jgi:aerobic C4-dicarboxylate transport protein